MKPVAVGSVEMFLTSLSLLQTMLAAGVHTGSGSSSSSIAELETQLGLQSSDIAPLCCRIKLKWWFLSFTLLPYYYLANFLSSFLP